MGRDLKRGHKILTHHILSVASWFFCLQACQATGIITDTNTIIKVKNQEKGNGKKHTQSEAREYD